MGSIYLKILISMSLAFFPMMTRAEELAEVPTPTSSNIEEEVGAKTTTIEIIENPTHPNLKNDLAIIEAHKPEMTNAPYQKILIGIAVCMLLLSLLALGFMTQKRLERNQLLLRKEIGFPRMEVLQTISVTPKGRLLLVQVGESSYLLSTGDEKISILTQVDKPKPQANQIPLPKAAVPSMGPVQQVGPRQRPATLAASPSSHEQRDASKGEHTTLPQWLDKMRQKSNEITEKNAKAVSDRPKKIEVRIDDTGINKPNQEIKIDPDKAIKDVTMMLREKLRNLPKFS